jgi:hypothetical protein
MKWGYYYKEKVPPIEDFTDGSHIIVVHKTNYYISNIVKLEDEGWEVRDCIKIQFQNESLQAGLLRKTFKGTVANNTIKNGCGGINIDICRISHDDPMIIRKDFDSNSGDIFTRAKGNEAGPSPKGRFPANLLLECTCEEVIKGENHGVVINNKNSKNINDTIYKLGHSKGEQEAPRMYKDEGNIHTDENCVCYQLDLQSGIAKSQGRATTGGSGNVWTLEKDSSKEIGYGDIGGASRYFYAFGDEDELKNYLISMIKCDNV